jgi:tyrosyl-tRNA synthetase
VSSAFDILDERGFLRQWTNRTAIASALDRQKVTYYIGFDATASSLHIGSLLPIMAMLHLQQAGHCPIAVIGGGTTMIGDPSGKTEMRKLLSKEIIDENGRGILSQLQRFLNLDGEHGFFVDNANWLLSLGYIEFLRDIGRYFRVNEMVKAEAYRMRLEREEGLSFIEFNYQLLQAYDFLVLNQKYGCTLQMGGDDQWGNIIAGVDLVRRVESKDVFGLTFPLLTTASGGKMGKTESGAVWLDVRRTSHYEFYQYWINTHDFDVQRFLALFTLLPMSEVARLGALKGAELRSAKEVLAFEVTKLAHGEDLAKQARETSHSLFGGKGDIEAIPTFNISREILNAGYTVAQCLIDAEITKSGNEARRLISQGGVSVGEVRIVDLDATLRIYGESVIVRIGKKKYIRMVVV